MSNLKHGFYSKNESINPDSVLMNNAQMKQLLVACHQDIIDVVGGTIVKPGVCDLVVYLIDCAMPHHEHLLPKTHISEIREYYHSRTFTSLRNYSKDKTLQDFLETVRQFQ